MPVWLALPNRPGLEAAVEPEVAAGDVLATGIPQSASGSSIDARGGPRLANAVGVVPALLLTRDRSRIGNRRPRDRWAPKCRNLRRHQRAENADKASGKDD
jgi:hypothetical protein